MPARPDVEPTDGGYIRRHYNAYMAEAGNQALGFIMTVYRRRLTSSFEAIKRSLRRRLSVLENGKNLAELLTDDDNVDVEGSLFEPEAFDTRADRLRDEIAELKSFLQDLDSITGEDSKASKLVADVTEALNTYSSVVVFTQYADTMDYVRERLLTAGYRRLGWGLSDERCFWRSSQRFSAAGMRSAKVTAKALSAGFHRMVHRACPVPLGSSPRVTR